MRLKNKNGDMITIPKENESKVKSFLKRGCNSCVDEYLQSLGHKYKTGDSDIKDIFANGGQVGGTQINVEGGEVADIPGQGSMKFEGPDHEQGGINTSLPKGTDIYSKRIKVDGKTMAQRKEDREKLAAKIAEKLDKNKSDAPLRNTRNRTSEVQEQQDQFDKQIQTEIDQDDKMTEMMEMMANGDPEGMLGDNLPKAKYGFSDNGPEDPVAKFLQMMGEQAMQDGMNTPQPIPSNTSNGFAFEPTNEDIPVDNEKTGFNTAGLPTGGDALKMFGNLKQGIDMERLARENRGGPQNVNHFENFGNDALETVQGAKDFLSQNKDKQDRKIQGQRQALTERGRNSSRSANTMRATDIASQIRADEAESTNQSNFASQMMQLLGQEGQLENLRDQGQMQGSHTKATEDTQDRDNFFSALTNAQIAKDQALSITGKDLNEIKGRDVNQKMLNNMLEYVTSDVMTGKSKVKNMDEFTAYITNSRNLENVEQLKTYEDWDYTESEWNKLGQEEKFKIIKEKNKK